LPRLYSSYDFSQPPPTAIAAEDQAMQTMSAASFATKIQACPSWAKSAARATLVFLIVKGSVMLATAWLAFRGFESL
jgi:hypothetical protein